MNRRTWGLLMVASALFVAAASARADEWTKTYALKGRGDLLVQTGDGEVSVLSSDQKDISARVTTVGYKIGPDDVRIDANQNGDHISIAIKAPHINGNWFSSMRHEIHVELRVPRDLDLSVTTGDGAVTVQPISGNVRIRTGDGSIHADSLKGDVFLHTGDGSIEGKNFDGRLKAESGDGGIHLSGRFDGLEVNTGDGSVNADIASGSKTEGIWSLRSGNGSITLRVPTDLRANLDLNTGDGSVTTDLPLMVQGSVSRSHVRGAMNGGGGEVKVTTGDGSIHVSRS